MLIQVVFADKQIGIVSQDDLDRQIDNGSVAAFRRQEGWVIIGRDQVRNGNRPFDGHERRGRTCDIIPSDYRRQTSHHERSLR